MAFIAGKVTAFKLDNAAGALQDLSAYSPQVNFGRPIDTYDVTTFGSNSKSYIVGLKDGDEFSVDFNYEPTVEAQLGAISALTTGASQTYEYGPEGSGSTKVKYTGECFLKNWTINSPVGDKATISASFQKTGDVTRTTFS